ncbi:MAG: hypothetical protein FWE02_06695 [Defluviitaleaceae bacterium]|nr:hypothetical protein [Defluviitaleaceae bacterium]
MKKKKYIRKTLLVTLIGFLIFWFSSLVHVWILTGSHGEVFKEISNENLARINIFSRRFSGGLILHFIKQNEEWRVVWWDGVWSSYGSADNFIWPLIR